MLLTISATLEPATDLGYLLHKRPGRVQTFELPFGKTHVFYTEQERDRCTFNLLLDIDPLELVRGPIPSIRDYVNDGRTCVLVLCVAISRVLGSAMGGHAKERPELARTEIPLEATLAAVPVRGVPELPGRLFEPLGYQVETDGPDPDSRYRNVRLAGTKTVQALLTHIYVLLPVLDNRKHYWIGKAELEKLLEKGEGWLDAHPEQDFIIQRYLGHRRTLAMDAAQRLRSDEEDEPEEEAPKETVEATEPEELKSLHEQRLEWAIETLKAEKCQRVVDLGCAEGQLLRKLVEVEQFTEIVAADASARSLERAGRRAKLHKLPAERRRSVHLRQTGLTYRDPALAGFDGAAVLEVVEHIEPDRLEAFEEALFGHARPRVVVLTTPNRDYNAKFDGMAEGQLRHRDHRFEWTREEFLAWAARVAERHGYQVETVGIGDVDPDLGPVTQGGRFIRCN